MPGSAIVSGNGVVLIEIPAGGATGEVLTKLSNEDFDFDWQPGGGGGGGSLQDAYDFAPAVPQITINGTPAPLTIDASVAGDIFAVRDVANADLLRIGTTGGSIYGGTNAGNSLLIQGAQNAPDVGRVEIASPIDLTYNTVDNTTPAEPFVFSWEETFTVGAYVGGFLNFDPTITTTSSTYIPGVFVDFGSTIVGAAPGFWAYTFINCLHRIESGAGFNFGNALVVNVGVTHVRETAGTSTTPGGTTGMNFAPQTRADVAGAVARKTTGDSGVTVNPSYSAVAGATADLGTTLGLRIGGNATVPFGGSGAGTLIRDAIIGLDVLNTTDTIGGDIAAVRSATTNGANRYVILNTGGADSEFGAGDIHLNDNARLALGNTIGAEDVGITWNGTAILFDFAAGTDFRISQAGIGRILIDGDQGATNLELTVNCEEGFSLGAQTGANGNQFGNFVTPARTIPVAGDYTDFLLTQGGNLTVGGLAMGRVSAWVINGISYANSTGSVANADTLTVGGMVTSSPGVTITERQSLFVIAGRSRHAAVMSYDPISPATLSAGDNNDWAGLLTASPNNGMRHWARVTGDAGGTSVITGIDSTSAQDGDTFKITNVGTAAFDIGHQDVGSGASNRIISPTGADYTLAADQSAEVIWDDTTDRWRILYGSGA